MITYLFYISTIESEKQNKIIFNSASQAAGSAEQSKPHLLDGEQFSQEILVRNTTML